MHVELPGYRVVDFPHLRKQTSPCASDGRRGPDEGAARYLDHLTPDDIHIPNGPRKTLVCSLCVKQTAEYFRVDN